MLKIMITFILRFSQNTDQLQFRSHEVLSFVLLILLLVLNIVQGLFIVQENEYVLANGSCTRLPGFEIPEGCELEPHPSTFATDDITESVNESIISVCASVLSRLDWKT